MSHKYKAKRLAKKEKRKGSSVPVVMLMMGMIVSMFCLAGTSWAWFSSNQGTEVAAIQASMTYWETATVSKWIQTPAAEEGIAAFALGVGEDHGNDPMIYQQVSVAVSESTQNGVKYGSFYAEANCLYEISIELDGTAANAYLMLDTPGDGTWYDSEVYYTDDRTTAFQFVPSQSGNVTFGVSWGKRDKSAALLDLLNGTDEFAGGAKLGDGIVPCTCEYGCMEEDPGCLGCYLGESECVGCVCAVYCDVIHTRTGMDWTELTPGTGQMPALTQNSAEITCPACNDRPAVDNETVFLNTDGFFTDGTGALILDKSSQPIADRCRGAKCDCTLRCVEAAFDRMCEACALGLEYCIGEKRCICQLECDEGANMVCPVCSEHRQACEGLVCICAAECLIDERNVVCPACEVTLSACNGVPCTCSVACTNARNEGTCAVCASHPAECRGAIICVCELECIPGQIDPTCAWCLFGQGLCAGEKCTCEAACTEFYNDQRCAVCIRMQGRCRAEVRCICGVNCDEERNGRCAWCLYAYGVCEGVKCTCMAECTYGDPDGSCVACMLDLAVCKGKPCICEVACTPAHQNLCEACFGDHSDCRGEVKCICGSACERDRPSEYCPICCYAPAQCVVKPTCECTQWCADEAINAECLFCRDGWGVCVGEKPAPVPEPTPEPTPTPTPEPDSETV